MKKETPAERMRRYRRERPDNVRATQRRQRERKRLRRLGDRRCAFCTVLLRARSVRKKSKKYCDSCRRDPSVRRYLRNLYVRRWNQKKKGAQQDSLTIAE